MRPATKTFLLSASLLLAGCDPGFKHPDEELKYLKALSNPTPTQWRRMRELDVDSAGRNRDDERELQKNFYKLMHPPKDGD